MISPKVSATALAGALVTVGMCTLSANHITIDPGVGAAVTVLVGALAGWLAPHENLQTTSTTTKTSVPSGKETL